MDWKTIIFFVLIACQSATANWRGNFDEQYFSGRIFSTGSVVTNYVENGTNFTAHIFTAVGTNRFVTQSAISAEVLVVAGGGAAYRNISGCGGAAAGGILYHSNYTALGMITVIVGNGASNNTIKGQDSYFGSLKAFGGGSTVGAGDDASGGSGSGRLPTAPSASGGASIQTSNNGGVGYGNAGGNSVYSAPYWMGSGGGAGGAGSNSGNGGVGRAFSLSGISTYYAGGGGQQNNDGTLTSGGLGGGGTAGPGVNGTGGGAGGARGILATYSGGSGIVIVRYVTQ